MPHLGVVAGDGDLGRVVELLLLLLLLLATITTTTAIPQALLHDWQLRCNCKMRKGVRDGRREGRKLWSRKGDGLDATATTTIGPDPTIIST